MANGLSTKLPYSLDPDDGVQQNKTFEELVRQNLKNIILTSPGERVMDVKFGVGLRKYLFELNNPNLHSRISSKIREQVSKYLTYLEIIDITLTLPDENVEIPNVCNIKVEYKIKPLDFKDKLDLAIDTTDFTINDVTEL